MARFVITPGQCRAARALLNWSQSDLAQASGVGRRTIADFELDSRTPLVTTLADMIKALEDVGIEFIDATDDHGPGVQRRSPFDRSIDMENRLKALRAGKYDGKGPAPKGWDQK
jgi:transcriptional regulator with XRE-family HTH domain